MSTIDNHDELRTIYRKPTGAPLDKVITELDSHCVDFLAKSPFMVLSTSGADGAVDGSPKGGEPGFARVLEDGRVAWADLSGNNRLDSFENIVTHSKVAMLFMIPGLDETLRINGDATLSTDHELCEAFAQRGRPAKVVVTVTVDEAYVHCSKALLRSSLWAPDTWIDERDRLSGAAMLKAHAATALKNVSVEDFGQLLEEDAQNTMWTPGGEDA